MAYKVFSNGDALTGSELNTYLMNQSVMVFASATARDAALTSPVEGQLVWLEDSNKYVYYTGSAWTDLIVPASTNALINGAFDINQRGFSSSTSGGYGFDRWVNNTDGVGATFTAQAFTPGTVPVAGYELRNFLQVATTGQTSTSTFTIITQRVEDVRSFAGQTVTVSFWAKAASGTPKIAVEVEQAFGSGGSSAVDTPAGTVTLSTSWARYSVSVAVPSIAGKTIGTGSYLELNLWTSAGSTFNTRASSIGIQSATIGVAGVQLESGSSATAFKRNASNIQGELAACQRYYYRKTSGSAYVTMVTNGVSTSSTLFEGYLQHPVSMRIAPTSVEISTLYVAQRTTTSADVVINSATLGNNTLDNSTIVFTVSSGLTTNAAGTVKSNNSATAYVAVSAEL